MGKWNAGVGLKAVPYIFFEGESQRNTSTKYRVCRKRCIFQLFFTDSFPLQLAHRAKYQI